MKTLLILLVCALMLENLAAPNDIKISISPGLVSTEFFMKEPLGFQLEGNIFYHTSNSTSLNICLGYNEFEIPYGIDGHKFKTIPIFWGARLHFPVTFAIPYFTGEMGFRIISRKFSVLEYDTSLMSVSTSTRSESTTKFALRVGIGSTFSIDNNLDIDTNIRLERILYEYLIGDGVNTRKAEIGNIYSFNIGLIYRL